MRGLRVALAIALAVPLFVGLMLVTFSLVIVGGWRDPKLLAFLGVFAPEFRDRVIERTS